MYRNRSNGSRNSSRRHGWSSRGFKEKHNFRHKNISFDPALLVSSATSAPVEEFIPQNSFSDFAVDGRLKGNILSRGYTKPTPIQDQAIPVLLQDKDVVGIANTGTGKTAAFLIPLINKVLKNRAQKILIIAPTRELAVQIDQEFRQFAKNLNIYSVICIGGVGITPQIHALKRNPNFVIGTPGRIKDLQSQNKLRFEQYRSIVLDEVDRMLDMGFIHDIKYIISRLPFPRHSLFFSATLPDSVKTIMHGFLKDPVIISVKTGETAANVDQDIVKLEGREKIEVLHDLLKKHGFEKVLVFISTKWGAEKLSKNLEKRGIRVAAIHGNKKQGQRQRAIDQFKRGKIQALIATDVASRGLDIDNVTHVINYDLPNSYEDYIHRIGRTGRANKKGKALTFLA